jgi:hypothetical protein
MATMNTRQIRHRRQCQDVFPFASYSLHQWELVTLSLLLLLLLELEPAKPVYHFSVYMLALLDRISRTARFNRWRCPDTQTPVLRREAGHPFEETTVGAALSDSSPPLHTDVNTAITPPAPADPPTSTRHQLYIVDSDPDEHAPPRHNGGHLLSDTVPSCLPPINLEAPPQLAVQHFFAGASNFTLGQFNLSYGMDPADGKYVFACYSIRFSVDEKAKSSQN